MRYVTGEEMLLIHARVVEETGGLHGMRDIGLFISITHKPRTTVDKKEVYASVFEKAAVYLEALANYHVFADGNKRTAIAVSAWFLYKNGYFLKSDERELEKFIIEIAKKKHSIKKISTWIKQNSQKR